MSRSPVDPLPPVAEVIPFPPAVALEIPTRYGPVLRGHRWGLGQTATILVHEPGTDLDSWADLPALLLAGGLPVIAVDLPGHGLSDDPWEPDQLSETLSGAADDARAAGAGRVFLVVAGASTVAGFAVAAKSGVDALVALSPEATVGEGGVPRSAVVPKLLFVGALGEEAPVRARALAGSAGGWTMLSTIPTAEQGTALLAGAWGGQVREQIASFLRQCCRPSP